ncbi:low molecular weight phosphatase family protein [Microbacterium sp. K24]|uniref:arsenate reductase/protein-tyrosine-phosphatase family protein n=1 Tax=Microbacterium sp. K24 TaxID=2305446 RepID=UPI001F0FBBFC|nr:low molecular weight phosphatase family protein [Microbacterium sp. K24]
MNAHHQDGPPSGMSRREWREQQDAAPEEPAALPDFLGGPVTAEQPRSALTILTVCTGNICRSPLAEVLLRTRLEPLGVRVHSAGTHALVGHGMPEPALELAVQAGADPEAAAAHHARYLVEPLLADADLILTMAREHRSHVVKMMPNRLRRTFTIREFARLASTLTTEDARAAADAAGGSPHERLAAVLRGVVDQRGLTASTADDDDVIDPYRRSRETYERSASQLVPPLDEVERIVRVAIG